MFRKNGIKKTRKEKEKLLCPTRMVFVNKIMRRWYQDTTHRRVPRAGPGRRPGAAKRGVEREKKNFCILLIRYLERIWYKHGT